MSASRRRIFWTLLFLSAAAFVWWLSYTPYHPDRVFEPIPASAAVVNVHHGLAAEWPVLTTNPVFTNLMVAAGVKPEDVRKLSSDPVTLSWMRRLAARDTVIAYVPSLGYQNRPGWVFATWVGPRSLMLRFQLALSRSADFRPVPVEHGRVVYITRTKFAHPHQRLSLALADGVLVGCISTDPIGARWLIETMDRYPWTPSLKTSGQLAQARRLLAGPAPSHWGWLSVPVSGDPGRFPGGMVAYTLDPPSATHIRASMTAASSLPGASEALGAAQIQPLVRVFGDSPGMLAIMPLAAVGPMLLRSEGPLWVDTARSMIATNDLPENALAVVSVLDQDHSGRIRGPLGPVLGSLTKGLRVPTLMMGYQVSSPEEAAARLDHALELLNQRYGTALVRRDVSAGSDTLMLIEDPQSGFYSKFEPDERVAGVVVDGWFFLCSNAAVLKKRLAACNTTETMVSPATPWSRAITPGAAALMWADFSTLSKTIQNLTGVVSLMTMATGSQQKGSVRQSIDAWRETADVLKILDESSATVIVTNGVTRIDVELGVSSR